MSHETKMASQRSKHCCTARRDFILAQHETAYLVSTCGCLCGEPCQLWEPRHSMTVNEKVLQYAVALLGVYLSGTAAPACGLSVERAEKFRFVASFEMEGTKAEGKGGRECKGTAQRADMYCRGPNKYEFPYGPFLTIPL